MLFTKVCKLNVSYRKSSIFDYLMMVMLFLSAINFAKRFEVFLIFAFMLFIADFKRCLKLDSSFLLLCFFSMFQIMFNQEIQSSIYQAVMTFIYPLSYLMGNSCCSRNYCFEKSKNFTHNIIYVTASGTLLHYLLNWYKNGASLSEGTSGRDTIDFWSNEVMSATGQATLACLSLCVISAFLLSNVGKRKKMLAIISLVAIMMYNFVLAGRTIIAMSLILVAFSVLFRLMFYKKGNVKVIIVVAVVLLALLLMYANNVFGVKDAFEQSNLYDRFSGKYSQDVDDDARLEHKLDYLKYIDRYPFGGNNIREILGFSAHDLYLDTYDESGIFATLTIIAFIVSSIVRAVKCAKNKAIPIETRHLLACVYLGVNIQFWLEPIMRGVPWLLAFYCMIDGAVTSMLDKASRE